MKRKSRDNPNKTNRSNIYNIYDVDSSSDSSPGSKTPSPQSKTPTIEYPPYTYSNTAMIKKIDQAIEKKLRDLHPNRPDIKSTVETLHIDSTSYDTYAIKISNIPAPFSVEEFPKMKKLILNSQKLDHEFDYEKMRQLEELHITKNKIPFEITNRIHLLEKLENLDLESSNIKTLPPYLAHMKNLKYVNVRDNDLTDFPEGLGNPNLVELSISKNHIVEFPPEIMKKMRKLEVLEMNFLKRSFDDQPTDALSPLCELKSLKVLNMDGLEGVKQIPENIGNLHKLEHLSMLSIGSDVSTLPESIGNLRELVLLRITNSSIESLPESIGKLKKLESFTFLRNSLRTLPDGFCKLKSLKIADLGHNMLRELPEKIGDLKNLTLFHAYDNQLTGLPISFCELHNLENLNLMDNQIAALPECFGNLQKLTHMNMQTNQLSSLPNSFSQLERLQYLYLSENQLANLPERFADLPAILSLVLSNNRLRNTIRAILPGLLQHPTLQSLTINTNGIRFTQEDIDMIQAAANGPRQIDITYVDMNQHVPYANILPGRNAFGVENAEVVIMQPAENAMEIHREYDMINKEELIAVLGGLKKFPTEYLELEPADENSFNSLLLSRLKKYLDHLPRKKEEEKAEYEKIMQHLDEITGKLKLVDFTGNITSLNIFYTAIEYVEKQPHEFQANYAYNYVLSNALAYCNTATDRTSCALGMKERIVMDLAAGSAGLNPEKIKDEYVEIARIIQLDKIPAAWTNIDNLQVKSSKIGAFASACVTQKIHQKKMRTLHGLPQYREQYKALKTDREREEYRLKLRKEYVENCITRKIVGTFTDANDRIRFRNASAPLVVKAYVEMPVVAEMLEDDAFPELSHGGRRTRRRKQTKRNVERRTRR